MSDLHSVDISGIPKDVLLAALYNNSFQQGMGFLDPSGAFNMSPEEADEVVKRTRRVTGRGEKIYFDYLRGRVMKVDIANDEMITWGYNRDVGDGAAEKVVASLRSQYPKKEQ